MRERAPHSVGLFLQEEVMTMRKRTRRCATPHRQKGQSLAELALLLPTLILLLALLVDVGRAFNAFMVITNAAREGARYGSQHPGDVTGMIQVAQAEATRGGLNGAQLTVSVTTGGVGQHVIVRTTYPFATILGDILGLPTITLSRRVEMLIYGS